MKDFQEDQSLCALLDKKDTFVSKKTSAGTSLCYEKCVWGKTNGDCGFPYELNHQRI